MDDRLFEEEHRIFRQQMARWVDLELRPHAEEWEARGEFPF